MMSSEDLKKVEVVRVVIQPAHPRTPIIVSGNEARNDVAPSIDCVDVNSKAIIVETSSSIDLWSIPVPQ